MSLPTRIRIPETPSRIALGSRTAAVIHGRRLGRHIVHDPRSLGHVAPMADAIATVKHERRVPIWDQGDVGSCTGNACAGMLCTGPFKHEDLTEADAVALYSTATTLDNLDGTYPPDDTGSSGLAVMHAARSIGWIKAYQHAFGLEHTLRALTLRPCIVGLAWREECDSPDENGIVAWAGPVRGGHEVCAVGIDAEAKLVTFANSWGPAWGAAGYFSMSWEDLGAALADNGDATFAEE